MHTTTNPVHDRRRRAYEHVRFGARDRPCRGVSRLAWSLAAASVAVLGLVTRTR